jgi:hypothetical protein
VVRVLNLKSDEILKEMLDSFKEKLEKTQDRSNLAIKAILAQVFAGRFDKKEGIP